MENKSTYKKIVARTLLILGVFVLSASAFALRAETPGVTFATYGIDLKIDSKATYNGNPVPSATWSLKNLVPGADKFWNFNDVKPGDYGENTISMHVKKSPAYLCLDFKNLKEAENGVNEPESYDDPDGLTSGELADAMEFFSWRDDGDNIFEKGEKPIFGTSTLFQSASVTLASTTYIVGDSRQGGSCGVNQTRYIGVYWCFGDLNVNVQNATISCDGSALGNGTQTDSMTVDVSIRAMPSNENPKFVCGGSPAPHLSFGSISGTVYHDQNKNSKKGGSEPGLSGWTINLYKGAGWWGDTNKPPVASAVTDQNGKYTFPNLANGVYSVEEINKSDWTQVTSDYWSLTIQNGSELKDKDFGNVPKKKNKKW